MGKKLLEICCGSGHSLKYHADKNASELWSVDISQKQIENADAYLKEHGYTAKFICSPMEADMDIPKNYLDFVYQIYGIGWTTDLQGTFKKIASYLKKGGIFIFSWHHTLNYCVAWSCNQRKDIIENDTLIFNKSYFDESYFSMPADGSEIILCNRKISTYINTLAESGLLLNKWLNRLIKKRWRQLEILAIKLKKPRCFQFLFALKQENCNEDFIHYEQGEK